MPRAKRIRCYQCGRKNDSGADSCATCGAAFLALCDCGAGVSVWEGACETCGHTLLPRKFPLRRLPIVRTLVALPIVALIVLAAWIALRPEPERAWQLKADAAAAFDAEDYDEALRLYRRATILDPSDAAPRYMQAVCYRRLGFPQSEYVREAQEALKLDPAMVEALLFLSVVEHRERGRLDLAIGYAMDAVGVPGAPARAHRLLAELELKRPQPDRHLALEQLRLALDKDPELPGLALVLARTQLQMHGSTSPDHFPMQLQTALEQAQRSLEKTEAEPGKEFAFAAAQAEIALGLQQHRKAFVLAEKALASLPPDSDPDIHASLLVLRGQARQAAGQLNGALLDFAAALGLRPQADNALRIGIALLKHPDQLETLLLQASRDHDPRGEVGAVLAAWYLEQGRAERAREAIATSRTRSPKNAFFAVLEGDLERADGDLEAARKSYQEAVELAPKLIAPRVRLSLLSLQTAGDTATRNAAVENAKGELAELRALYPGHPAIHHAMAILHFAGGDVKAAEESLRQGLARSPGDPRLWRLLGDARRSSTSPDALTEAASAYGKARQLRPEDVELAQLEAQAWLEAGNPAQALVTLDSVHRRLGETIPTLRLRAQAHRAQEAWGRASTDLARLRELGDASAGVLLDLVDAEFRAGREIEAMRRIEEVRAAGQTDLAEALDLIAASHRDGLDAVIARMEQRRPSTGLAELYLRAGRIDDAIDVLRGLHEARPLDGTIAMLLALALLDGDAAGEDRIAEAEALVADLGASPDPGCAEFIRGRVALARNDPATAVTNFRVSVTHFPAVAAVQFLFGEALIRSGDRARGMAILRKAVSMPGALPGMRVMAAQRALQTSYLVQSPERAESLAAEALRLDPSMEPAARRWIGLLTAREDFRRATNVAEAMLALDTLTPEQRLRFRFDALLCRVSLGELGRAEGHLASLEGALRDSQLAVTLKGIILVEQGDHPAGEALLVRALDTPGGNPRVPALVLVRSMVIRGAFDEAESFADQWRAKMPPEADIGVATARHLRRAFELERALRQLRTVLERNPTHEPAVDEATVILGRLGRPDEALAIAERYRDELPEERRWYGRLLHAKALLTYSTRADEALQTAIQVGQQSMEEHTRMLARIVEAEALLSLRRVGEADGVVSGLTEDWQDDRPTTLLDQIFESRIRFVRGVSALHGGYFAAANADLTRCLEIDPESLIVRNNLAWGLAQTSEGTRRAHELAKDLTREAANEAEYWDTRGHCAEKVGDERDAEDSYRRALALFKERGAAAARGRARTQLALARFLRSLARHEESVNEAREVLEYAPDSQELRDADRFLNEGTSKGR